MAPRTRRNWWLACHALGYQALAFTDECSVSGVVRAHQRQRELGLPLIIGSEVLLDDGLRLVLLAVQPGRLCPAVPPDHARAPACRQRQLTTCAVPIWKAACRTAWCCCRRRRTRPGDAIDWLATHFAGRAWLAVELLRDGQDAVRLQVSARQAERYRLPRPPAVMCTCTCVGAVHCRTCSVPSAWARRSPGSDMRACPTVNATCAGPTNWPRCIRRHCSTRP